MILRSIAGLLALLLVAVSIPAWRHLREQPPPPPATVRGAFTPPSGAELGAGDDVLDAAMSPDGRRIAFVATSNGAAALWVRNLGDDATRVLDGTAGASLPAWSPDGSALLYFAGGRLRRLDLGNGGSADVADAPAPRGAAWLPNGSIVFSPTGRGPLRRLQNGTATDATMLRDGEIGHLLPVRVGDANDFAYVAVRDDGRRDVRLVNGPDDRALTRTSGHAEVVGDVLVHLLDGTLSAQRIDAERGMLAGGRVPLAFEVGTSAAGRGFFAASARVVVSAGAAVRARQLVWISPDGRRLGTLGEPADYWQVRLSADDRRAAITMLDPLLRTLDVFVRPTTGTATPRRVSLLISPDTDPVWAPDGTRVLYRTLRSGRADLVTRPAEFSEAADVIVVGSDLEETGTDWRGGDVLFQAPGQGTGSDLWRFEMASGRLAPVARGGFNESDARWSPDGRAIAYVSDEPGQADVFVAPWPALEPRIRVTQTGGTRPRWSRDGNAVYFLRGDRLMRAGVSRGAGGMQASDPELVAEVGSVRDYEPARLSDRLLAILPVERTSAPPAGVVVDWMSLLPPAAPR